MTRRDLYRYAALGLGNLMALALAIPGVAYLLDPILNPTRKAANQDEFRPLARLSDLQVDAPKAFPIIAERQDAWVKYPAEPVGTVWLIRRPNDQVLAFSAECPHLGCAVSLAADGQSFFCPCHTSAFDLQGRRQNEIPPRGMDALEVAPLDGENPLLRVRFRRFQSQTKEIKPLV